MNGQGPYGSPFAVLNNRPTETSAMHRLGTIVATCVLLASANAFGALWNVPPRGAARGVAVVKDFVADFDESAVVNSVAASASLQERAGHVPLPGIFLHTQGMDDAIVPYADVKVPKRKGTRCFLLFRIAIRDGVPWGSKTAPPNGVRFKVVVDGDEMFVEDCRGTGWRGRAIDLSPWAGESVTVEFRTNAIAGNTSYDWAVFGDPLLVEVPAEAPAKQDAVGVALAEVTCTASADVTVSMGDVKERLSLDVGAHWVPLHYEQMGEMALAGHSGSAELGQTLAGPYDAELSWPEVEVASPLVTAEQPFTVIFTAKNIGRGTYTRGETVHLRKRENNALAPYRALGGGPRTIPRVEPNETVTVRWENLRVWETGDWDLEAGPLTFRVHVFPGELPLSRARSEKARIDVFPAGPIAAQVSNPWSRLTFFRDGAGAAYAVAETWNGGGWQRAGSLYPLAGLTVKTELGKPETLALEAKSFRVEAGRLVVDARFEDQHQRVWQARLAYQPDESSPRIRINVEVNARLGGNVVAFCGPTVLAGDRAFGVEKDFAIFPGLEYLHGDEPSSSERDLAYPHSDRRVPAIHKIATPLMAVQGQDALVALLWDAKQEWADDERLPAARFLAPPYDSGRRHIHMGLFAPSVGEYVRENEYQAATPYKTQPGERLRLEAWLVLDHKARYDPGSVVHGPHGGGLVLQAMQHWFDTFGMPEPSTPPRPWGEERALCRKAYAGPVWSEDPPGWRHCAGWDPLLLVGQAVPQLLDVRAGVDDETRAAVEGRITRVLDRAMAERGPHYFWSSAGCHILMGELPFYHGFVAESMTDFRKSALGRLAGREEGLWLWHPGSERHATLGDDGAHTLGQAAHPSMLALRAARMTGDPELATQALEAMAQMALYDVPRGAQMWECPMYQPDILAAGHAIRAYCEAYRLTGDPAMLDHARYWAWTGLPFLYLWELDGYPTMKYNVISVIGSTFYSHSWLGMPVVWCGLVYGYALQDLAEFDDSFPWTQISQGIVNSTMWQQYADGPSVGCYPDSWHMVKNKPNPADINPENILVNEFRLRGRSPEISFARFDGGGQTVMLNSAAHVIEATGSCGDGIQFTLRATPGFPVYSLLAPVDPPTQVQGAGEQVDDSTSLQTVPTGWHYAPGLRGLVLKHTAAQGDMVCSINW